MIILNWVVQIYWTTSIVQPGQVVQIVNARQWLIKEERVGEQGVTSIGGPPEIGATEEHRSSRLVLMLWTIFRRLSADRQT